MKQSILLFLFGLFVCTFSFEIDHCKAGLPPPDTIGQTKMFGLKEALSNPEAVYRLSLSYSRFLNFCRLYIFKIQKSG